MSSLRITYLILIFFIGTTKLYAQKEDVSKKVITNSFSHSQLINNQTTEMMPRKTYEFRIQHRFGQTGFDESAYKDFLGLDLPANIRFALNYSLTDKLYIGVGRTKYNKTYDFEGKYLVLSQTEKGETPISVALYFNTAVSARDFPETTPNTFFADSVTLFEYSNAHRLSYNSQIIISKKINNSLSFQISPTVIYQNLVEPKNDNYTMVIPFSGRIKIGLRSSFIFEYAYVINNRNPNHLDPFSFGFEFGTAGHTFQLICTSSNYMLEQNLYTNKSSYDYLDKKFALGFNIKRTFWRK
jgi:hypothetical protein